jgi:hypothetical protein
MDAQGRILLPQHLREFASLDKRVALVGQGGKFEIWDEQRWKEKTLADLEDQSIGEMAMSSALGKLKFYQSGFQRATERAGPSVGPIGGKRAGLGGESQRDLHRRHLRPRRPCARDPGAAGAGRATDRARSRPRGHGRGPRPGRRRSALPGDPGVLRRTVAPTRGPGAQGKGPGPPARSGGLLPPARRPRRGFSFSADGPLDMRMDPERRRVRRRLAGAVPIRRRSSGCCGTSARSASPARRAGHRRGTRGGAHRDHPAAGGRRRRGRCPPGSRASTRPPAASRPCVSR